MRVPIETRVFSRKISLNFVAITQPQVYLRCIINPWRKFSPKTTVKQTNIVRGYTYYGLIYGGIELCFRSRILKTVINIKGRILTFRILSAGGTRIGFLPWRDAVYLIIRACNQLSHQKYRPEFRVPILYSCWNRILPIWSRFNFHYKHKENFAQNRIPLMTTVYCCVYRRYWLNNITHAPHSRISTYISGGAQKYRIFL